MAFLINSYWISVDYFFIVQHPMFVAYLFHIRFFNLHGKLFIFIGYPAYFKGSFTVCRAKLNQVRADSVFHFSLLLAWSQLKRIRKMENNRLKEKERSRSGYPSTAPHSASPTALLVPGALYHRSLRRIAKKSPLIQPLFQQFTHSLKLSFWHFMSLSFIHLQYCSCRLDESLLKAFNTIQEEGTLYITALTT